MPSLCSSGPIERPGVPRSTRNAENCSPSTFAYTVNRSAKPALVMNCLLPSSLHEPSGWRVARVRIPWASEPAPGSVSA